MYMYIYICVCALVDTVSTCMYQYTVSDNGGDDRDAISVREIYTPTSCISNTTRT